MFVGVNWLWTCRNKQNTAEEHHRTAYGTQTLQRDGGDINKHRQKLRLNDSGFSFWFIVFRTKFWKLEVGVSPEKFVFSLRLL